MNSCLPRPRTVFIAAVLAMWMAIAPQAWAQATPAENQPLLRALNALRQQGCEDRGPRAGALRENSALSRAASLVAGGRQLNDAMKAAGYRAVRATQVSVSGITGPGALTRKALGKTCSAVMHRELQEVGFFQRGKQTWLVLAAPFAPPQPAQADDVQARVLALVNAARARPRNCGNKAFAAAPPLRLNPLLYEAASVHAADMAQHSYFSHTGRDGSTVDTRATRAGYTWQVIGENIAAGQTTADIAMQGWLASPGHCVNIMSPAFEEMGTAFVVNTRSTLGIYWAQVFGAGR
ncbi:MAG: CAP domain-containing protein [Polaromonas sp.]|nr:CAP domain-containing protein [Polaromonas sp.]